MERRGVGNIENIHTKEAITEIKCYINIVVAEH